MTLHRPELRQVRSFFRAYNAARERRGHRDNRKRRAALPRPPPRACYAHSPPNPQRPHSFTFSCTRPAIAGILCLYSRFKANAIVLLFVLIFFEHLTIVSVSRKMVDACL